MLIVNVIININNDETVFINKLKVNTYLVLNNQKELEKYDHYWHCSSKRNLLRHKEQ